MLEDGLRAGVYKHYRGGYYQLLGVAEHTETGEKLVVYVALTGSHLPGPRIRARPLTGPEGWRTAPKGFTDRFFFVGNEIPQ